MTGPVLRAGAWPAAAGVSGAALVVGGCGAAFPVVDVTPTGAVRRTEIRAVALLAPVAGTAVVLVLVTPGLVPQVARWVRTFPAPGAGGPSSDPVWWSVLVV